MPPPCKKNIVCIVFVSVFLYTRLTSLIKGASQDKSSTYRHTTTCLLHIFPTRAVGEAWIFSIICDNIVLDDVYNLLEYNCLLSEFVFEINLLSRHLHYWTDLDILHCLWAWQNLSFFFSFVILLSLSMTQT